MQHPVRKSGMEEITCASCVHYADLIRGSIPEAVAIPSERATLAQRCAEGAEAVLALKQRERFQEVLFARGIEGELLGRDWIIDERKKTLEPGIHVVQIGDDRNSGGASPGGCEASGCRVVPIHMQKPRGGHPSFA